MQTSYSVKQWTPQGNPRYCCLFRKFPLLYSPLGNWPITLPLAIRKIFQKKIYLAFVGLLTIIRSSLKKNSSCLCRPSQTRMTFLFRPQFCWHKRLKQLRNFKSLRAQLLLCIYSFFSQTANSSSNLDLISYTLKYIHCLLIYKKTKCPRHLHTNRMKPEESTLLATLRKKGKCKLNSKFHLCLHLVYHIIDCKSFCAPVVPCWLSWMQTPLHSSV